MIESLHNHTIVSDGQLTHKELFELCESLDFGAVAFTDHDALPNEMIMKYLESVRNEKTKWIIGIEITTRNPEGEGEIHLVGLFVDPNNKALITHCKKTSEARIERMKLILMNLHKLGFVITEEDCLKESHGESVGRPHIVAALLKYKHNQEVIQRLADEMKIVARQDASVALQYQVMLERGFDKYAYILFLTPDSFKHAYVESRYMPKIDEAVKLIRDAGGVAILAHYSSERKKLPMYVVRDLLQKDRIDGVEVIYGLNKIGTTEEGVYEDDKVLLGGMVKLNNKLVSGGADAHDAMKIRKYAQNLNFSRSSAGMAKAILDSGKVGTSHKANVTSIVW